MIQVQVVGSDVCRRYQRMRERVLEAATILGISVQIDDVTDTERLVNYNPLSLPSLFINQTLLATKNPPSVQEIKKALQQAQGGKN